MKQSDLYAHFMAKKLGIAIEERPLDPNLEENPEFGPNPQGYILILNFS